MQVPLQLSHAIHGRQVPSSLWSFGNWLGLATFKFISTPFCGKHMHLAWWLQELSRNDLLEVGRNDPLELGRSAR